MISVFIKAILIMALNLNVISFNSTGLNLERQRYISELLGFYKPDIMMLQETWMFQSEICELNKLSDSYKASGVSGMSERERIVQGRKYGGVACLWNKSIAKCVKPYKTESKRLFGLILTIENNQKLLLLNAYLPCDNYLSERVDECFMNTVNDIELAVEGLNLDFLLIGGDLNIDLQRNNAHSKYIENLCERLNVKLGWLHQKAKCEPTYMSPDGSSSSCIDHFMIGADLYRDVCKVNVLHHPLHPPGSWHRPIQLVINIPVQHVPDSSEPSDNTDIIAWSRVKESHCNKYKSKCRELLGNMDVNEDLLQCQDKFCQNECHLKDIDRYCAKIIECCTKAGSATFPKIKRKKRNKPFWNELVEPLKEKSMLWGQIWHECGEPQEGLVKDIYRKAQREYHYMVKYVNRNESTLRKQKMLDCMEGDRQRDFWSESYKVHKKAKVTATCINGENEPEKIAQVFAEKYKHLYNSVPSNEENIEKIRHDINEGIKANPNDNSHMITKDEVKKAAQKLKAKKPDGDRALWSNHIKFGPEELYDHISKLLTLIHVHGSTAYDLLTASITSLVKDKLGDLCDSGNYRGTALISAIAKMYDLILIDRYKINLQTSPLQFAYKKHHSTLMCHSVVKEVINYYLDRDSEVYTCMLDASKAFDRMRYDKLFELLVKRGFPPIICRALLDMYTRQLARTTWNNCNSEYFGVQNGIRQGGIISPLLYTIYCDELLQILEEKGVGCHIGTKYYGGVSYADDLKILCPSVRGLQSMVDTCAEFGIEYDILYNEKKSVCIVYSRKRNAQSNDVSIFLNGTKLDCVRKVKHLGMWLTPDLENKTELIDKRGSFIGQANHVLTKYAKMSSNVKCRMIDSYCCHFYGAETWDFNCSKFDDILTSWNIAIRKSWNLPYRAHRYILPVLANHNARDIIYNKFLSMYKSMYESESQHVKFIARSVSKDARSLINLNLQKIAKDTNTDIEQLISCNITKVSSSQLLDNSQLHSIESILELDSTLNGLVQIPGFSVDELKQMIDYFAEC